MARHCDAFDASLTQEQLNQEGYLDFPDAVLGRCVKALAADLLETKITGFEQIITMASCLNLINQAVNANATNLVLSLSRYSHINKPEAPENWKITVEQI